MRLTATCLGVFATAFLMAQQLNEIADLGQNNWLYFHEGTDVSHEDFARDYAQELGLTGQDNLALVQTQTDEIGMVHYRYQQQHNNVPVEAAIYLLHERYGRLQTANGQLVFGLNVPNSASLTAEQAIAKALEFVNAERYMWEGAYGEEMIKRIENDPNATYYPTPELVIYNPDYSGQAANYTLCYKMDIYAAQPSSRQWVYIDANTGAVVGTNNQMHDGNVPAVAETRYSGTQNMMVDSITPGYYILREYTRGSGIETYNMHTVPASGIPDSAVDFYDADNYWNNANAQYDEVGTDVHWGNEMVYDYYFGEHALDSYDGNGKLIVAYVHVDNNWFNARFTGDWMEYGDGSGNPLTSIDIVGHEMTHGVTRNSSGLIYQNESGALNESFSDIFGTAVERYATPDSLDWEMGKFNFALRDMSNPNAYGDPDTYKGTNWYSGIADNGGVHINSGVQNFWFYLMCTGGTGTNDNGDNYNVIGVGFDNAEDIAFRNLVYYLTPSSEYEDARNGSIQSAMDLFGACSFEVNQVADAWYAVGVGSDTLIHDLKITDAITPVSDCNMSASETVGVTFTLLQSGCNHYILPTDSIGVGFRVDGGTDVIEYFHPVDTMFASDSATHTFTATANLSGYGEHLVDVWISQPLDLQAINDSILGTSIRNTVSVTGGLINFENILNIYDTLIIRKESNGRADVHTFASNGPGFGMRLSGNNPDDDHGFDMPGSTTEIWTASPDYFSSGCFCVDATAMSAVNLGFDLKMSFSKWYYDEYGFDLPHLGSTMRVMVDGVQISPEYHPTTYMFDPFETHIINLDTLAGTQFELCFEGMCFVRIESDFSPDSKGDNAFIDNVWIGEVVSVNEQNHDLGVSMYPNPNGGTFTLQCDKNLDALVTVVDVLGRTVHTDQWNGISHTINLELPNGMYYVRVQHEDAEQVLPLILH